MESKELDQRAASIVAKVGASARTPPATKQKQGFDWSTTSKAAYAALSNQNHKEAERLLTSSFKEIEKFGANDERLAWTLASLGACQSQAGNMASAQVHYKRASCIYSHLKKTLDVGRSLWFIANCQSQQHQYRRAARTYLRAFDLTKNIADAPRSFAIDLLTLRAKCHFLGGNRSEALTCFREALKMAANAKLLASDIVYLPRCLLEIVAECSGADIATERELLTLSARSWRLLRSKLPRTPKPQSSHMENCIDTYFGTPVLDPYRWLEDPTSKNAQEWLKNQASIAKLHSNASPFFYKVQQRAWQLFSSEQPDIYYKKGAFLFYEHKPPMQMPQLYRTKKKGQFPKLVFDSNLLPKNCILASRWTSPNGELLAYGMSENGSDWVSIKILKFTTGKEYKEVLHNLRNPHLVWSPDSKGFYYCAFTQKGPLQGIYFHKLGTSQRKDVLIYEEPDNHQYISITSILNNAQHLELSAMRTNTDRYSLWLLPIKQTSPELIPIFPEQQNRFYRIGATKDRVYFWTDKHAPMGRVVSIKNTIQSKPRLREEIAERDYVLKKCYFWKDTFFLLYSTPRGEVIETVSADGTPRSKQLLPKNCGIRECCFTDFPIMTLRIEGLTTPNSIYEFDIQSAQMKLIAAQNVPFDPNLFTTEVMFARSKDGTRVPYYVSYKINQQTGPATEQLSQRKPNSSQHRRGQHSLKATLKLNGDNPTLLTGYGGFSRHLSRTLDPYNILWMELGGVCVNATLRGDADLGRSWRDAGKGKHKQNTFDDFIAVAKALVRQSITRPARLGIKGASNGGLLVAAALTQQPHLFGAVCIDDGLLDMLRYHKFDFARHYICEYGSPDIKADFDVLRTYSPLHNVRFRQYPPVIISASANDDRVNPSHSYKFAAELQAKQLGNASIVLMVEPNRGHRGTRNSDRGIHQTVFFGQWLGLLPEGYLRAAASRLKQQRKENDNRRMQARSASGRSRMQ